MRRRVSYRVVVYIQTPQTACDIRTRPAVLCTDQPSSTTSRVLAIDAPTARAGNSRVNVTVSSRHNTQASHAGVNHHAGTPAAPPEYGPHSHPPFVPVYSQSASCQYDGTPPPGPPGEKPKLVGWAGTMPSRSTSHVVLGISSHVVRCLRGKGRGGMCNTFVQGTRPRPVMFTVSTARAVCCVTLGYGCGKKRDRCTLLAVVGCRSQPPNGGQIPRSRSDLA
ncbi:hypothetical protein VTK26DRAFT_6567 [Humicola hyalothermophila]